MAVKMKSMIVMKATAECPSHSRSDVTVRDVTFTIDEPIERGGDNIGPTPGDTALGALIGCTNIIGNKCADKLGVDIGQLSIDAKCEFDRRGVTLAKEVDVPFVSVTLDVLSSGSADQAALDEVAAETAKFCPLSKLFEAAGTKITVNWRSA